MVENNNNKIKDVNRKEIALKTKQNEKKKLNKKYQKYLQLTDQKFNKKKLLCV